MTELRRDLVFLGTGFDWRPPKLVQGLAQAIGLTNIEVTRGYRLAIDEPADAACYLQGINEATHGIGDSLLSVLAHRARDITLDVLIHRAAMGAANGNRAVAHGTNTLEHLAGR